MAKGENELSWGQSSAIISGKSIRDDTTGSLAIWWRHMEPLVFGIVFEAKS